MYQYQGFGLNIASGLEIPELLPHSFEHADITINTGKVPEKLEGPDVVAKRFNSISEQEYLLDVLNIARYYVGHGKTIIIEPYEGVDNRSVRVFLLGTVIAAALYQRNYIPLHASAILKDDKLILFAGHSGAGKSTLLAHLSTKGYQVFTDDICVLQKDEATGAVYGMASYPMIKLWEDAMQKIGNDSFDREFSVRPNLPKYGQFFHDTFNTGKFPVAKIFLLSPRNENASIDHAKLNSLQAFKRVEKQAYKYRFAAGDLRRSTHFLLMSALVNTVEVIEMKRPSGGTTIEDFSNIVETLL